MAGIAGMYKSTWLSAKPQTRSVIATSRGPVGARYLSNAPQSLQHYCTRGTTVSYTEFHLYARQGATHLMTVVN